MGSIFLQKNCIIHDSKYDSAVGVKIINSSQLSKQTVVTIWATVCFLPNQLSKLTAVALKAKLYQLKLVIYLN